MKMKTYMIEHYVMHIMAIASFVIMWASLVSVVDQAHAVTVQQPQSSTVELLSVPVIMTLGACASTAVFVWFVTEDRRKQLRRIDALEKGERQAVRYLRAIMRKLNISAKDILVENDRINGDE
jgi:anaerobic C4-dicarboxylate transporter